MTAEQPSLFPDLVPIEPEPVERLSPDRRRTARQKAMVAAGVHPLTGTPVNPAGTCGGCAHRYLRADAARPFPKCAGWGGRYETRGPGTDVRAWWPACEQFQRA